jgi:peptidoglycan/LPS O-acetylase OafA/YrhL
MSMKVSVPRLASVAGLQFLATLHIVLFYDAATHFDMAAPLANLVRAGWTSFSLLFVMTGFLLAYNWIDPTGKRAFASGPFWSARFARVYPLYLIALLVGVVAMYLRLSRAGAAKAVITKSVIDAVASVPMLQAWAPSSACSVNCPAWAISDAALFVVVFPLFVGLLSRMRGRTLLVAAIVLWIASIFGMLVAKDLVSNFLPASTKRFPALLMNGLAMNPLLRLPEFLIGAMLGRYFLDNRHNANWHAIAPALAAVSGGVLLFSIAGGMTFPEILHRTNLLVPIEGALIFSLALLSVRSGTPFSSRWMLALGQFSLAIFLFQYPVHELLRLGTLQLDIQLHRSAMWMPVYLGTLFALSVGVTMYFAEPLRTRMLLKLVPPRFRKNIPLIIGQKHTIDAMEGEGTWEAEREADRRISKSLHKATNGV